MTPPEVTYAVSTLGDWTVYGLWFSVLLVVVRGAWRRWTL